MPAVRFTRVFVNDTPFEEHALQLEEDEPAEEVDLRLHDDDDDGEEQVQEGRGAEDWIPESTGTAVLHAGCPRRSRRTLFVFALRARHASTEALTATCFHADAKTNRCLHFAVVAHVSGRPANYNHHPWWWCQMVG